MNRRVAGLFAVAILIWGINYPFVKLGLTSAPPLWLGALRIIPGLAVSLVLLFLMKTGGALDAKQKVYATLLGIPGSTLFIGFWMLGSTVLQPGIVSVFLYTYPLWTMFLSIPVLGDRPPPLKVGAAFLGFFGVALASRLGFAAITASQELIMVELLVGAFGFATMNVAFKRLFKGEQLIRANIWQLAGAAVTIVCWAALTSPIEQVRWSLSLLGYVVWAGVLGTAVVYVIFFTLLARYNASSLTAYFFLVVIVALTSSYFVFGETIDALQGAGVIAIVIAIYLVGRTAK